MLQSGLYCTEKLGWEKVFWGEWVLKISIQKKKKNDVENSKEVKEKKLKFSVL